MPAPEESRFKLTLHYDGSGFFGWQVQREERTVQGELEAALERLTGAPRRVMGSGRTDRGVHATGQVAAVTLPSRWTGPELRRALNAVLPDDLWVREVAEVNPDFHPRYHALERTYRYRVGLVEESRSPFHRRWCWPLVRALDRSRLEDAAEVLTGSHSFRAFRKTGQPERGDRCTVVRSEWTEWSGRGVEFRIAADRFLHHMVRYLVGTMVDVARERRPLEDMQALLEGGGPELETSAPAPPQGLFLERVRYPDVPPPHEDGRDTEP